MKRATRKIPPHRRWRKEMHRYVREKRRATYGTSLAVSRHLAASSSWGSAMATWPLSHRDGRRIVGAGIYCITCIATGERYIGLSMGICARLGGHLSLLEERRHPCLKMQRCFRKYGVHGFSVRLLVVWSECREQWGERGTLREFEKRLIAETKPELNDAEFDPVRGKWTSPRLRRLFKLMKGKQWGQRVKLAAYSPYYQ